MIGYQDFLNGGENPVQVTLDYIISLHPVQLDRRSESLGWELSAKQTVISSPAVMLAELELV
jgi:hypothetical protein